MVCLLRRLPRLPASGGASIAAHVDHVRYGLELMNRWSEGEADPWSGADWTASWRRTTVSDEQWAALREQLRDEARRWHKALQTPRAMSALELNGVIASVAHLAYHLGAIRQIDRSIRRTAGDLSQLQTGAPGAYCKLIKMGCDGDLVDRTSQSRSGRVCSLRRAGERHDDGAAGASARGSIHHG